MTDQPETGTRPPKGTWKKRCLKKTIDVIHSHIPITDWLVNYSWKKNLWFDFCAGVTLVCLNVPQSLSFAVLANVPLIYGLYTGCFSALVYTFFGTATISSFGPVAIASMLTGEAVATFVPDPLNNLEIALPFVSTLTFTIGVFYFILFALQMGVITTLFRKPFVSGFIAGCTLHILVKSAKLLLGFNAKNHYGFYNFYFNAEAIIKNIHKTNWPTVVIMVIVIGVFVVNTLWFKDWFSKKTKFVLPVEALVMVTVTLLSYLLDFRSQGVPVVGYVPTGLPQVIPPSWDLIYPALPSAVSIGSINYATTLSMTMLFNEQLRPSQDTLAMSVCNIVCSNFQCLTVGNSMMRTVVAMNVGIKTLLATTISSILMLFVILFAGPLFQYLPSCVLGSIIFTSTGQLLYKRIIEVPSFFKSSLENGCIWIVTFIVCVGVEVQIGLIIGTCFSLRQILSEVHKREVEKKKLPVVQQVPEAENLLEKNGKKARIV